MSETNAEVLGSRFGDDDFPLEWREGEKELFWILDDLHCPNPISPMFFDIGGWWLTCDHMFRRFGTPFASDWIAKRVNGYLYTAAVPADPSAYGEASEYGSRYVPRVPESDEYAGKIGAYLGSVLPHYAYNFLDWWRERLRPEMDRNFAYLDSQDTENMDMVELAILLEDAIDIHDRHWKIHWMLNFSQFSATTALNATIAEVKGEADPVLVGRLQSSTEDRNWDAVEDLWKMKEEIKGDEELRRAFEADTAAGIVEALNGTERGRRFISERLESHQQEFGYKAIWAHEFQYQTWKENPAPILEAVRGYLATDYDYQKAIQAVGDDLEAAKRDLMDDVPEGEGKDSLQGALDLSLRMNPLTPDHHFYIDQGTNARVRLVLIAIGRKLVEDGRLDDPEDVMYLRYNELRRLMAGTNSFDAQELVGDRRDQREDAYELRPRDWVGTATEEAVGFPYWSLWAFPEKLNRPAPSHVGEIPGLPASAGVVEGTARVVLSPEQFGEVERDEIIVCRMTSPSWVVLFTKISGLVTDAGGMASHPAVVSREFGIPAVVGTSDATRRIRTGDRVRVNGSTGRVEIVGDVKAAPAQAL